MRLRDGSHLPPGLETELVELWPGQASPPRAGARGRPAGRSKPRSKRSRKPAAAACAPGVLCLSRGLPTMQRTCCTVDRSQICERFRAIKLCSHTKSFRGDKGFQWLACNMNADSLHAPSKDQFSVCVYLPVHWVHFCRQVITLLLQTNAMAWARETGRPAKVARRAPQYEGDQGEDEPSAGKEDEEDDEEEDDRMPAEGAVRVSLAGGSTPKSNAAGAARGKGTAGVGGRVQEATCAPVHLQACKLLSACSL